VVINHRAGDFDVADFSAPARGCAAVAANDEWPGRRGGADSGDGFGAGRDIDHGQGFVRNDIETSRPRTARSHSRPSAWDATAIKLALDGASIDLPFPHTVVLLPDRTGSREGDVERAVRGARGGGRCGPAAAGAAPSGR
jgi:hypothetical protein